MSLLTSACVGDFLGMPGHPAGGNGPPPPPVRRLVIRPESGTISSLGDTTNFAAGWWQDGDITPAEGCVWSVSDPSIGMPAGNGTIMAVGNGQANVTASCGDTAATAALGVWQAVATITVAPGSVRVPDGGSSNLRAVARDANGNYLDRPVTFGWKSSAPAWVDVQPDPADPSQAVVTRYLPGNTSVTASAEGSSAKAVVR